MTISKYLASFHKTPPVRLARGRFASACSSIARGILCQRGLLQRRVFRSIGCIARFYEVRLQLSSGRKRTPIK